MKKNVKIGFIGLGRRGLTLFASCFTEMSDVEITAICDIDKTKLEYGAALLKKKGRPAADMYTNYHEMLKYAEVDAVVIMTGWNDRLQCAMDCMEVGKYTAIEVGCAYDISECYKLIGVYERTKTPIMMLENCCYGRREMCAIRMNEEGLFGEIVLCSGGYHHDLCKENLFKQKEDGTYDTNHYRIDEYVHRNCEQYPTHELGPISKLLKINRGNRMLSLRSIASASKGLKAYIQGHLPEDHPYYNAKIKQSDIITTIIDCAGGEQIILTLDTTLPRSNYSRQFTVRGTKGMCQESIGTVCTYFLDGMEEGKHFNNEEEWFETHDHPLHAEYLPLTRSGHGGMDWLVIRAFIESVKHGVEPPIDAYDTALWLAIAPLSEASIAKGGSPVEVPDFTKGKWFHRGPGTPSKYTLDMVCKDSTTPIVP